MLARQSELKVAVLSDIHGNLPALSAVAAHIDAWRPDHVVVNGDVVNRGPRPHACWQFVAHKRQTAGWRIVRGNHEDYVIDCRDPHGNGRRAMSWWTYQQLGTAVVDQLDRLPDRADILAPDGSRLIATHATARGRRDLLWPWTSDEETAAKLPHPRPAVFVTSHVHLSYIRPWRQTLIVNTGAVGSLCEYSVPPQATYAQIVWRTGGWTAEIVRLPYDTVQTNRDYTAVADLFADWPLTRLVYHEWRTGYPLLSMWRRDGPWHQVRERDGLSAGLEDFLLRMADLGVRDGVA